MIGAGRLRRVFLAGALGLLLVIALTIGVAELRARREQSLVRTIEAAGATIRFQPLVAIRWSLRLDRIGDRHYRLLYTDARGLDFAPQATDTTVVRALTAAAALDEVVWVDLSGTRVSVESLATLSRAPGLRALEISRTSLGNTAMPVLQRIRGLRILSLRETEVAGSGWLQLLSLPSLEELDISGTAVTLSPASPIPDEIASPLRALSLAGTPVATEDLRTLVQLLPELTELDLSGTGIRDSDLLLLRPLAHLATLDLADTRVTATGVAEARSWPALRLLVAPEGSGERSDGMGAPLVLYR